MNMPVRILHLDDDPLDGQLVAMALEAEKEQLAATLRYVCTREEYLSALQRRDFDLILSDYRMPGFDGDEALKAARALCPEIPFIMVTGELGEELVIETLKRGATDYVLKDRIFRLVPAIKRALAEAENNRKRREAEEHLRESEERYRRVVFNIHDALLVDNVDGNVVFANDRFLSLFGSTGEDLATIRLEDYIAPEYRPLLRDQHSRRMRGELVPAQFEYRGVRTDGAFLWLEVTVVPLVENGAIIGTQSTIRDITERHEAEAARDRLLHELTEKEEALRDSEERYRAALETHGFMLAQTDREVRYIWIHDPLLGFDPSSMLGKRDSEMNDSPQARRLEGTKRLVIETGTPFRGEVDVLRPDGVHCYEMSIEPRRDKDGKIAGVTTAGLDITERKKAEQALRESRETLALAVKVTNLGLFDYYPQSGLMLWNTLAKEHFGLPPDAHIDYQVFLQGIHPEDREHVQAVVNQACRPGGDGNYYVEYRTFGFRDHKERHIVARGRAFFDSAGNAVRLIGARSDVTAQKRTEEVLRAHEATLDAFFQASPAILGMFDEELRFVQTDRLTPEFLGVNRQELLGKCLKEFRPRFAQQFLEPILRRVLSTGKPELNIEVPAPRPGKTGERGIWQTSFFPVPLPDRRSGLGVMAIDITDLKTAQREIQRLQEEYRLLVEQQSDMVARVSREGKVLYVNRRCLEMTGLTEPQMIANGIIPEVDPEDYARVWDHWMKTFEDPDYQSAFETKIKTAHGWRWLSFRTKAILDPDNQPTTAIVVARDVTERKVAEEELRRREARFQLLISSSKDAIALVDEQGCVLAVSESAAEVLGYPVEKLIGKDVHTMVQEGQVDGIAKSLRRLKVKPDNPQFVLVRLQSEEKRNVWVELEATAILAGEEIHAYFFRLRPVVLEAEKQPSND